MSSIPLPSRRAEILQVAVLLVAVPAAGCVGAPSSTPTPEPEDPTPVVTDPTNYTYVDNASLETGGHVHDYWDGKSRLTVIDRSEFAGFLGAVRDEGREQVGVFRPRPGTTIPQGTATVRVNVSWTETLLSATASAYQNPELRVRTAADDGFQPVAEIQSGDTVTIESTNANNDLPHRQLSAWAFALYVEPAAAGTTIFQANVTIRVEAVRGLELPVFPAHPDLWRNRSQIALVEETHERFVWGNTTFWFCSNCDGTPPPTHRPTNGTVVPFDASMVRVRLEPLSDSPTRVGLEYHGADTWNWTELTPDRTEGRTRVYDIPVSTEKADGPYNEQSLWRFQPYITDPAEDRIYVGSYRINATAFQETPGG